MRSNWTRLNETIFILTLSSVEILKMSKFNYFLLLKGVWVLSSLHGWVLWNYAYSPFKQFCTFLISWDTGFNICHELNYSPNTFNTFIIIIIKISHSQPPWQNLETINKVFNFLLFLSNLTIKSQKICSH